MKKLKLIIILLTILIVMILLLLFIMNEKRKILPQNNQEIEQTDVIEQRKLNVVTNQSMYFTVKSCIETYIDYIIKQDKNSIYKILDSIYIQENNITEETVLNYTGRLSNGTDFDTQKMLLFEGEEENIQKYYVYGILRTKGADKANKKSIYLTVNIDLQNMIFSITPNVPDEEVFYE